MATGEMEKQILAIRNLIKATDTATGESIELMSHWAKYTCVIVSGLIENGLKEIYSEFIRNAASKPVASYSISVLSGIQNPKASKFIELAGKFKANWAKDLEIFLQEDGRGDAIDSIMSNRHLIAHGKYSGITMSRVKEYLDKSIEVLDFIKEQSRA